ncbi:SDR family NAD(P)-dependent oxidoreductase [Actinoplanes couchii]|uniref:Short-chain dehydrogenase n=1 Tax=Actinoplanes couchii TaxID=403638 RepID=A0ABQ3XPE3_9ACTN|nr:SDR family NAD(P)-dependent oxidoreductase [Actinoplanes couchii]MDR6315851.1 NAD(P)-dependent dehydrogenase (short-subunit alcohol dehydrogenase family) [Actinoplanes couchii]GID60353.1 short-chain dehydrogenase [Actinoplanes couchii]
MTPRTIIITGASDGIGAAAARQLAARGERVVVVGRSPDKTAAVAAAAKAPYHLADYGSLDQVRRLAAELLDAYPRIDVLANNAGQNFRKGDTGDGFDKSLQVNHLAPVLLTTLLMDRLVDSGASVIQTASEASRIFGRLDLDDLNNRRKWSADKAYGDSKIANILFTSELQRRYGHRGLNAVSFHPGEIATNMGHDTSSPTRLIYRTTIGRRLFLDDVESGGRTLARFVQGVPGVDWQPGRYYVKDRLPKKTNPQIGDIGLAERLWERTQEALNGGSDRRNH